MRSMVMKFVALCAVGMGVFGSASAAAQADLVDPTASFTAPSPGSSLTIGDAIAWDVQLEVPADTSLDAAKLIHIAPDGFTVDGYGDATCTGTGCPSPPLPTPVRSEPLDGSVKSELSLGTIAAGIDGLTVKFTVHGHLKGSKTLGDVRIRAGDILTSEVRASTTTLGITIPSKSLDSLVVEPALSVTKSASPSGFVAPGTHVAYTVTVKNEGGSPAYNTVLTDLPSGSLKNVVVPVIAGANLDDGWSSGDPDLKWTYAGAIPAHDQRTFQYTADVREAAALHKLEKIGNSASVESYGGGTRAYPEPGTPNPSDSIELTADFPNLTVTTEASSDVAEVDQPLTWTVKVRNDSEVAVAKNVGIADTLPANWAYVEPGAGGPPTISSGDLTWSGIEIAPKTTKTIAFVAKPTLAAASSPGSDTPNTNTVVATAQDETLATRNADGPYMGTGAGSTILKVPALRISSDRPTIVAGAPSKPLTLTVANTGAVAARNVIIEEILPAGLRYSANTATSSAGAAFSETEVTGQKVTFRVASIGAGAAGTVTITIPVFAAASSAKQVGLPHEMTVRANETAGSAATGEGDIDTRADMSLSQDVTWAGDPTPKNRGRITVTQVVRATNQGPSDAQNVALSISPKFGGKILKTESAATCKTSTSAVNCDLGLVGSGTLRKVAVTYETNVQSVAANAGVTAATTTPTSGGAAGSAPSVMSPPDPGSASLRISVERNKLTRSHPKTLVYFFVNMAGTHLKATACPTSVGFKALTVGRKKPFTKTLPLFKSKGTKCTYGIYYTKPKGKGTVRLSGRTTVFGTSKNVNSRLSFK